MLLAGVMLIALLTSGKAAAQNKTVTLNDADNCGLTVSPTEIAEGTGNSRTLTLSVAAAKTATHKLPTEGVSVSVGDTPLDSDGSATGFSYSAGTITLGDEVNINDNISITAAAVEKSVDVSLSSLTYSISGDDITEPITGDITPDGDGKATVNLDAFIPNGSVIALTPTVNATELATVSENNGIASYSNLTGTATFTVTAENTTATRAYTITFNSKDQLATVENITVSQFDEHYATATDAIAALQKSNANANVTSTKTTVSSLPITWSYIAADNNGEDYKPAGGETNTFAWTLGGLENLVVAEGVQTSGTVVVTNVDASTDAKLSALTYSIGGEDKGAVTGFTASDETETQSYTVTLPATTPKDAEITVVPTKNDEWATVEGTLTATLENNAATISFTVAPESSEGTTRTISITFNRTPSNDASLSALKYKIGSEETAIDDAQADVAKEIKVPFGTTAVTVLVTPTDPSATVAETPAADVPEIESLNEAEPVSFNVNISGETEFKFTVTAEDKSTQNFILKFVPEAEKVTKVNVPETFKLSKEVEDAAAAILLFDKMEGIEIETNGKTSMHLVWSYDANDNKNDKHEEGAFSKADGAQNTFTWNVKIAATGEELEAISEEVKLTGKTTVTNFMPAKTGEVGKVEISETNPVDKIGDGETKTTAESVTVGIPMDEITFNKVEITKGVTINQEVGTVDFKATTINQAVTVSAPVQTMVFADSELKQGVTISADVTTLNLSNTQGTTFTIGTEATDLALIAGGTTSIKTVTNAGKLTLKNQEVNVLLASLAPETRAAAIANKGAIEKIENNGTFIDETATIFTVDGAANVAITQLPTNQSTTGKEAKLSIATAAPANDASISYQWLIQNGSGWDKVAQNSTDATLSIARVNYGTTSYRCEVTSTKEGATTTLYTPAVSVTFKSAGDPTPSDPTPTPSTKTYTVTLKKVTGATFSKGETTKVDEGENFSFTITLDKNYNQSKPVVKVGTTTYEPDAKGVYTIKNITKDITIEVTGIVKNTTTGVEETTEDAVRVWSEGSNLYIHTPQAADVYVVSGAGALLRELKAVPGDQNMQLPAGFYIVRVGTYTAKVIIR